jgi:phage shock protein A
MLDDLKTLFSRTWESFRTELERRGPEDQVAELLSAMRREMVEARAALPVLEEAARRAGTELAAERRQLEDCVRRKGMAERIGDAETARLAEEFAEKHRARVALLEDKARVARREQEMRAHEAGEMVRRYKEADANRFALLAELRSRRAASTLNGALGGERIADMDRMKERIRDTEAYARALEELDTEMGHVPPPPSAPDVEERLRELKRRLGQG